MRANPGRHLILTGFKACGKSTIGRLLAGRLGRTCVDLDQEIEALYESRTGRALAFREIYREVGGEGFRALELEAARALAERARRPSEWLVIALGGGALIEAETRAVLKPLGIVILLDVPFEIVLERIERRGFPATIQESENPAEALRAQYLEREAAYREAADLVVEVGTTPPAVAARRVLCALGALAAGLKQA